MREVRLRARMLRGKQRCELYEDGRLYAEVMTLTRARSENPSRTLGIKLRRNGLYSIVVTAEKLNEEWVNWGMAGLAIKGNNGFHELRNVDYRIDYSG